MILITGAGGKTGRTLIKTLSKVESVCAFVHSQQSASVARALGAGSVRVGDLLSQSDVRRAMQSARAVYHICPNMHPEEVLIGRLVIDEARQVGVGHFVYHSVLHPQIEQMPHHWAKMRVEQALLESGLPFTILQPAAYMQNLLAGWESILKEGLFRVPYSMATRLSLVDLQDVGEAARVVLQDSAHAQATYELVGTPSLSQMEVAEGMSRALGRPVRVERETLDAWRSRATGLSPFAAETLTQMFDYYDRYGFAGSPHVLRSLLGREPGSLEAFLQRAVNGRDAVN